MKERLKTIGSFAIWIAVMVGIALVAMLLIRGGVWLSDKLYPWLVSLSAIAIAVSVFILLPLAPFKKTRGLSGAGFFIVSYVFGATLWVWSLLLTYVLWGGIALFIGLFIAGVGVLPIAMLATAFNGMWSICGQLILLTGITFATRAFGVYLVSKAEEDERTGDAYAVKGNPLAVGKGTFMKERRVVFTLLLLWALAFGVTSWLESQTTPFKALFFGLGDSLILVGVLYLIWNWVASRRTIHSRGVLRRVVFGFLLGWALLDAVQSGLEARALQAPAWVGVVVFFLSLGWSLIFIVLLYLAWNWIAGLKRRGVRAAIIVGMVVVSAIGLLALGFLTDSKQRTSAESEVPQDAAVTKSQTPKTPPSPAASQETASPHLPGQQPTPTPLDLAPVVIEEPKPAPLEPGSQNLPLDASLSKGKATYRISGVMAGDFLNMRQGPGISYPVIQRLQNGVDGVTLIGDSIRSGRTKWQKINSRGVVGWVNADYLTPSYDGQNTQGIVAPNARGR